MVATITRTLLCLASVAAVSRLLYAKTPYTSVDAGRRNLRSLGALLDPKTVEVKSTPQGAPAVVGRGDSDDIMLLDNGQDEMIDNDFRDGDQVVIEQSGGTPQNDPTDGHRGENPLPPYLAAGEGQQLGQQEADDKQKKPPLEFVDIPKTGGSSVEFTAAREAQIAWGVCKFDHSIPLCYGLTSQPVDGKEWKCKHKTTPWHCPPSQFQMNMNLYEGSDTFAVVSNPYDRIVRQYYWANTQEKRLPPEKLNDPNNMNDWIQKHLTSYSRKGDCLGGHCIPMHIYTHLDGQQVVTHILHYETLAIEFEQLMLQYSLPLEQLDNHELVVDGQLGSNVLNAETVKIVNDWAGPDFDLFGYEMVNPDDLAEVSQALEEEAKQQQVMEEESLQFQQMMEGAVNQETTQQAPAGEGSPQLGLTESGAIYDESCPLLPIQFFVGLQTGSNQMSIEARTLPTIAEAIESGQLSNRKILLVGDSVMGQVYTSLSCLAMAAGQWAEPTEKAFWSNGQVDARVKRVKLKGNTDLMLSSWAGEMLEYGWTNANINKNLHAAFKSKSSNDYDWIKSCEMNVHMLFQMPSLNNPDEVETMVLTNHDTVYIHGTVHPGHRLENLERVSQLFQCMASSDDPSKWPRFVYVASMQQHFDPDEGGAWSEEWRDATECASSVNPTLWDYYKEETQLFAGYVPMIGRDLGMEDMGDFHLGRMNLQGKAGSLDCTHWSLPGVPDLIAKEMLLNARGIVSEQ